MTDKERLLASEESSNLRIYEVYDEEKKRESFCGSIVHNVFGAIL